MLIEIPSFAGVLKRPDPGTLPPQNGQQGINCRLDNGALRPWKAPAVLPGLENIPNGSAVWHPQNYVVFEDYVQGINAPMANDNYQRLYYAGDTRNKADSPDVNEDRPKTTYEPWISKATVDRPLNYYWMGVPAFLPGQKPLSGDYAMVGKGEIKKVEIGVGENKPTIVYTTKPFFPGALKTGDYVTLNYPGLPDTAQRIRVKGQEQAQTWSGSKEYFVGDYVTYEGSTWKCIQELAGETFLPGMFPATGSPFWEEAPDGVPSDRFELIDFKLTERKWTRLDIYPNGSKVFEDATGANLIIGGTNTGVAVGDKVLLRSQFNEDGRDYIYNTRLGTVVSTEGSNSTLIDGVNTEPYATSHQDKEGYTDGVNTILPTRRQWWVVSTNLNDFSLGKQDAEGALIDGTDVDAVEWFGTDDTSAVIYTLPKGDQNTWIKTSLIDQMQDTSYFVTCVNAFGEEGGPSYPSDTFSFLPGDDISFKKIANEWPLPLPPDYEQEKHGCKLWRMYRADKLGNFRFVADILMPKKGTTSDTEFEAGYAVNPATGGVTEAGIPAYSASETYAAGEFVTTGETNLRYFRSMQNGNINHTPGDPDSAPYWSEVFALPYVDNKKDNDLGEPCPTVGYLPPPKNMRGLVSLPNGMVAGFSGPTKLMDISEEDPENQKLGLRKEVCVSVPYQCHAFPISNRFSVEYEITGMAATQAGLVIATKGKPYILIGDAPERMTIVKLEVPYSCTSARSIVDMGDYAIYASPAGLVATIGNTAKLITDNVLTREQWAEYDHRTLVGGTFGGKYFGFCAPKYWDAGTTYQIGDIVTGGTEGKRYKSIVASNAGNEVTDETTWERLWNNGFVLDVATGDFSDLSTGYNVAINHLSSDQLYVISYGEESGSVSHWDAGPGFREFAWTSKTFQLPRPASFGAAQVIASNFMGGVMSVEFWFGKTPEPGSIVETTDIYTYTQRVGGPYKAETEYTSGDVVYVQDVGFFRSRKNENTGNATPATASEMNDWWVPTDPTNPFRLPGGFYASSVTFRVKYLKENFAEDELLGDVSIRRIAVAESMGEVAQS